MSQTKPTYVMYPERLVCRNCGWAETYDAASLQRTVSSACPRCKLRQLVWMTFAPDLIDGREPGPAALGQALVVKLEPGLDSSRINGIYANLRLLPGVESVTDLAILQRETLELLLAPAAPV